MTAPPAAHASALPECPHLGRAYTCIIAFHRVPQLHPCSNTCKWREMAEEGPTVQPLTVSYDPITGESSRLQCDWPQANRTVLALPSTWTAPP